MKVTFEPDGVVTFIKAPLTVLEAASKAGIDIESICGGRGLCGKCKVRVVTDKGKLPTMASEEKNILRKEEVEAGYRLACKVLLEYDATVYIPSRSRRGRMRLQTEGLELKPPIKQLIKKRYVKVSKATLKDQRSDEERLLDALKETFHLNEISIEHKALRRLPSLLRKNDWKITAVLWGEKLIDVEPGDASNELFGLAVDLGTTKIALYLLNLIDGDELAVVSKENPQRIYGEDIMTRMTYANRGVENPQKLHDSVIEALNMMVDEACRIAGVDKSKVYEAVFVGNTVMHHFLLNLETKYLAQSPYTQVLRRPFNCSPSTIGLQINQSGNAHMLPTIKSFVGADNVAVCLVTRVAEAERPTLALDIGTNTEIDCGSKELGLTVTSTPSGPAFEGYATEWGISASDGAIERIYIDPDTLEVLYRTIGDKPALGICGSGYVDAIAEMMKAGILGNRTGFNEKSKSIRRGEEGNEIVITSKEDSGVGKDIVVTQKDVHEIVKAKAAIHAAITILLEHLKLREGDIDKILLAGAFGSYIDSDNARTIGMLPELDLDKIVSTGNAAGSGAKLALLNVDERARAEEISGKAVFIELATHPRFVEEYVNSMYLPHKNPEKYPRTSKILVKK